MSNVREILQAFDDATLEALANKGLVRRAHKDLATAEPRIIRETEDGIVAVIEDCELRIPAVGPAAASCSCPAGGICRHILATVIHLRDGDRLPGEASPGAGADSPARPSVPDEQAEEARAKATLALPEQADEPFTEILTLDAKSLQKWAGKARLAKALDLLAEEIQVDASDQRRLIVYFPGRGIRVFLIRGTGLDGIVVDGPGDDPRAAALAAVLHYQRIHGTVHQDSSGKKPIPAKPVKIEPVEKAGRLLEEMVGVGLSHLSDAFTERLTTGALAAAAADLPRLSLLLRSVAEEVELILTRAAQASEDRLLRLMARTHALCQALLTHAAEPRPAWIGRGRTVYEETATLELHGVAAYQWESKSDYHGITLVFWDSSAGEWLTWSEARPRFHLDGFSPASRYQEAAPWGIGAPLHVMARSHLELCHPKRNPQNRLSSTEETRGRLLGTVVPGTLPWHDRLFTNWLRLRAYAEGTLLMGLDEYEPLKSLVVLKPVSWGRRAFDQIRQEFHWPVEDDQGASILLRVPYEPVNEGSITILEHLSPQISKIWGVLGRLSVSEGAVSLYPLSLLGDTPGLPLIHLTLDEPKTKPSSWLVKAIHCRVRPSGQSYTDPGADPGGPTLLAPVSEAEDLLLACAERGTARLGVKEREGLRDAAGRMYRQSLPILGAAFERLADRQDGVAACLLPAFYLAIVHDQAAARLRSGICDVPVY